MKLLICWDCFFRQRVEESTRVPVITYFIFQIVEDVEIAEMLEESDYAMLEHLF